MRIEILPDADALAVRTADLICDAIRGTPAPVIGLPTGDTPVAAYAELARRVAAREVDVSGTTVYAIDEFADATRTTAGTNSAFFREHLALPFRAAHIPNPGATDADEHIRAFADALRRQGGFDLCVLGIGRNGHIAFNEPGSALDSRARVVELEPASREAHAASFGSLAVVPTRGMTLGVADLLESRVIVVVARGAHKAAAVRDALEGPPTERVPASWLQKHASTVWLLEPAAASLLARRTQAEG